MCLCPVNQSCRHVAVPRASERERTPSKRSGHCQLLSPEQIGRTSLRTTRLTMLTNQNYPVVACKLVYGLSESLPMSLMCASNKTRDQTRGNAVRTAQPSQSCTIRLSYYIDFCFAIEMMIDVFTDQEVLSGPRRLSIHTNMATRRAFYQSVTPLQYLDV